MLKNKNTSIQDRKDQVEYYISKSYTFDEIADVTGISRRWLKSNFKWSDEVWR